MAVDLASLVTPWRAAVVTSEIQNGVLGEPSAFPQLAKAARKTMIPATTRLVNAARLAGVQVIHCTFSHRPDFKATNTNARLFMSARRSPVRFDRGGATTAVIPEVGAEPDDLVLTRAHGLNPMAGTDLDPVLRNLDLHTVVVAGVSVNVAITNLVMDAVNHGYDVVLPRDAVCGVPADYADAMIDNTLSLLATLTTVDELVEIWSKQ
ncbi:MAG: isochorismatase family protein [Acidimicrobiales bacterium]